MYLPGTKIKLNLLLLPSLLGIILLGQGRALLFYIPSLLVHEWAHMLAARAFGLRLDNFELLPFGCSARLCGFAVSKSREILTAAAGPAVNMVIASAVFLADRHFFEITVSEELITANVAIAAVNLLPALPLDGGHIARAAFSTFLGQKRATKVTAVMGVVFAAAITGLGLAVAFSGSVNAGLFIMGLFLCLSAIREMKNAPYTLLRDMQSKRQRLQKSKTIGINRIAALKSDKLGDVLDKFEPGKYNIVTVIGSDLGVMGELDERSVLDSVIQKGVHASLASALGGADSCAEKPPMLE